nr:hypothetical protein CFP56_48797 [Quercus suber]
MSSYNTSRSVLVNGPEHHSPDALMEVLQSATPYKVRKQVHMRPRYNIALSSSVTKIVLMVFSMRQSQILLTSDSCCVLSCQHLHGSVTPSC